GLQRPYEGVVKIAVNNPYFFALQYRQQSDPVQLAKLAIEDVMKRYTQRTDHDAISDDTLRYEMRLSLGRGVYKNYGLEVVEVLASNLYLDPKRAEILTIKHQGLVEEQRIQVDAAHALLKQGHEAELQDAVKAHERTQDTQQRQHEREEEMLQNQHNREEE